MNHVLENAKAYVALAGALAAALLEQFGPDGTLGKLGKVALSTISVLMLCRPNQIARLAPAGRPPTMMT